jgi:hypothetical protein
VGEDTRRIEDEIRAERGDLDRNLEALETRAHELADWRTHYRRHTGVALGVAFGGGFLLAALMHRGRSQGTRAYSPEPPRLAQERRNPLKMLANNPHARQQVGQTWDHIVESLIGLGSMKAIEWLGTKIPGFRDEYESRHAESTGSRSAHRESDYVRQ